MADHAGELVAAHPRSLARDAPRGAPTLALRFNRSLPAFALVRAAGGRPQAATSRLSMLELADVPEPALPGSGWVRLRPSLSGICGSDLAALSGHVSTYLDHLTSYPFVLGHEVVGVSAAGDRFVVEPALGCEVRGLEPRCAACAAGWPGLCERADEGAIDVGLQTGYCASTGGGWGESLVAHRSQLHRLPDDLSDEAAVMIEPLACCVHAALRAAATPEDTVLVYGAGAIGLLTVAAVRVLTPPKRLVAVAKHPTQREHALRLGADQVFAPDEVYQRTRFITQAKLLPGRGEPVLLGGAEVVFDCVGTGASLSASVRLARGHGKVVAVGMPGEERVDLAPVWQRELQVLGAYAYGVEPTRGGRRTFQVALDLAPQLELERLVGPLYPLHDYEEAITYAMAAGRLGAVRVAFDQRP